MAELQIAHLRISKQHLLSVPADERMFYFQLGHFANEVIIFRKIAIYAFNGIEEVDPVEHEGRLAMAMLATRFTAGRVHEANGVIHAKGNGRRLANLVALAPPDPRSSATFEAGLAAQKQISTYFGKGGHLAGRIRNKLAFHSDPKQVDLAFERLPQETVFVDFVSGHMGDSLYGSSEVIAQEILNQLTDEPDLNKAAERILNDVLLLSGQLEIFVNAYRLAFMAVFAPENLEELKDRAQVREVPALNQVSMPFFTQPFAE
jgi:hypothetical protein